MIPERLKYSLLFDSEATLGEHRFMVFSTNEDLKNYFEWKDSSSYCTFDTQSITNSPETEKQLFYPHTPQGNLGV